MKIKGKGGDEKIKERRGSGIQDGNKDKGDEKATKM
jgi:hypothetical protein